MKIKALSLISGGLDSMLAAKLMQAQGIEVIGVNFTSPVFRYDRRKPKSFDAATVARQLDIALVTVDTTQDILEILKTPKHGFGSNVNPCIDCHIMMLKKAKEMMKELNASFLVTGEVLGQRPMSQGRDTLRVIDKEAGVKGLVLRPLSAKVLDSTLPEEKGWIDRNRLDSITGRSRKDQIALAQSLGIREYPSVAGGCLLTDPSFSKRVKDLREHDELTEANILLLKAGRNFRLTETSRLIVGRDEHDNRLLEFLKTSEDVFFEPEEAVAGASGLGHGDFSDMGRIVLAARIVSRYFDRHNSCARFKVEVSYKGKRETLEVEPFSDEDAKRYLI